MTKETAICKIYKENNVVHLQFNEFVILKDSHLIEIYEYIDEVYGKIKYPKLIDLTANLVIDEKAKQYLKDQNMKYKIKAQAVLIGKNTNQEILDIYMEMNSKKMPSKLFTDHESAVNWLNSSEALN